MFLTFLRIFIFLRLLTDVFVYIRCGEAEGEACVYSQLVGILHHVVDVGGNEESGIHAKPCRRQSS